MSKRLCSDGRWVSLTNAELEYKSGDIYGHGEGLNIWLFADGKRLIEQKWGASTSVRINLVTPAEYESWRL